MGTTVEREAKTLAMLIEMLQIGLITYPEAKIGYRVVNNRYYEFQIYNDDGDKMSQWNSLMNIKADPSIRLEHLIEELTVKSIRQIGGKYVSFRK